MTKALGLSGPQATVRADASAAEAASILSRVETSAAIVVDDTGRLVGILSDEDLLRCLLPEYVGEAESLARVLEEGTSQDLWRRLEARNAGDLLPPTPRVAPVVDRDATLIEVASVMMAARVRLVAVVDDAGQVVGGITNDAPGDSAGGRS